MSFALRAWDPTDTPLHPTLAETAAFAAHVHAGQTDKAGHPYYLHLARVARHLVRLFPSAGMVERHAAWLHDVLEDTDTTADDLRRMGYAEAVIDLVAALTKPMAPQVPYADWIAALADRRDMGALRVKIADLTDNSDPERLQALPIERARELSARYGAALQVLQTALSQDAIPEYDDDETLVSLSLTLPAMDRWTIEEAARIADRRLPDFVLEEITDLAYRITGQGNVNGIPLARDREAATALFIKSFSASERKHGPIRDWVDRQMRKDVED